MDILWIADVKWAYLRTRKHQLLRRVPPGTRVFYVEPFLKGRSNRYRLRREGDVWVVTVPFVKPVPGGPLRSLLDQRWVRRAVELVDEVLLARHLRAAGWDARRRVVILSNIFATPVALRTPRRALLYDMNDAHDAFPGTPDWAREYLERLVREADGVIASSRALLRRAARIGGAEKCRLIGNGVDFRLFAPALEQRRRTPPARPVIGYVGAVAPWVDLAPLEAVARRHPEWEVRVVGPAILGAEEELRRLQSLPNFRWIGPVPHEEVPRQLAGFTLSTIPMRRNSLTEGVNPDKLYEYLAAGLPVVSTPFSEEVRAFPDWVSLADSPDSFVEACEAWVTRLQDPDEADRVGEAAREAAAAYDWGRIAERYWETVRELALGGDGPSAPEPVEDKEVPS
jgi:glycosyltransferase involved in cell wall biosynthesis